MVRSAYIHIPFCRQKCHYCSFVSFPLLERKREYLQALARQIKQEYKGEPLKTLYFGGGTPSLLSVAELQSLLALFNLADDAEVTLEVNPETVNREYFRNLSQTRINRLSIGVQSFDNEILTAIGRKHKSQDVHKVVQDARKEGFSNISLDFIYGLPNQSIESFVGDLERAVAFGVEHISLYGLKIEDGCYFSTRAPENLADDEQQAQMYLSAIETLEKFGFEHYEISNFARDAMHSKHNVNYWKNQEYYGFGLAAHGYVDGVRYSNVQKLTDYCQNPWQRDFSQNLSLQEQLEEEIFLGLRLKQGINISKINEKFNVDFEQKYKKILQKYLSSGHFTKENDNYCFTNEGFLISSYILADFIA